MRRAAALALIAALAVGCGGAPSSSSTAAVLNPIASATPDPTPLVIPITPRPTPTADPTPDPTPAPIDPALVFDVFKKGFWSGFQTLYQTDFADTLENDYVVAQSVDKVSYNDAKNVITVAITTNYESVYLNDHAEWRTDTWEVYRDYGRDFWGTVMEEMGTEISGQPLDWPKITPTLLIDAGRLSVSCPGAVIVAISQRQATQADFAKGCKFTY